MLTVNVGRPLPNPWKGLAATGIEKRPVGGPVLVTAPVAKGDGTRLLAAEALPESCNERTRTQMPSS